MLTNVLLIAILLGIVVLIILSLSERTATALTKEFEFESPARAISSDLSRALYDVNTRLYTDWKGSAFPMKFDLGNHPSWTGQENTVQILSGLLERAGWTVWKTPECKPNEIMVDVPRKKF